MCGENYWKGISVFCLSFGLSVFVSSFFAVEEFNLKFCPLKIKSSNEQQIIEKRFVDTKNCVPLDQNLTYEELSKIDSAPTLIVEETLKDKLNGKKQKDQKKLLRDNKKKNYSPSKDTAEYKTLLHKEKCYEEQK